MALGGTDGRQRGIKMTSSRSTRKGGKGADVKQKVRWRDKRVRRGQKMEKASKREEIRLPQQTHRQVLFPSVHCSLY